MSEFISKVPLRTSFQIKIAENNNVREDALDLAGYQLPICKNRASRGGGVMLYVKNEIGAIHRTDLECNDTELLWVELRPGNKKIVFGTCYRPPGMTALQVDSFLDSFFPASGKCNECI